MSPQKPKTPSFLKKPNLLHNALGRDNCAIPAKCTARAKTNRTSAAAQLTQLILMRSSFKQSTDY